MSIKLTKKQRMPVSPTYTTMDKNWRQAAGSKVMLTMSKGIASQYGSFDYNSVPAAWTNNVK
jgi:hypothetical protein